MNIQDNNIPKFTHIFIKITGSEIEIKNFNSLFYNGSLKFKYEDYRKNSLDSILYTRMKRNDNGNEEVFDNHSFTFNKILPIHINSNDNIYQLLWGMPGDISEVFNMVDNDDNFIYRDSLTTCDRYFVDKNHIEIELYTDQFNIKELEIERFFKYASVIFNNLEFYLCKSDFNLKKLELFKFKRGKPLIHEDRNFKEGETIVDIFMNYYGYTLAMVCNAYHNYDFIGEKIERPLKSKEKTILQLISEDEDIALIINMLTVYNVTVEELFNQKRLPDKYKKIF